MVLKNGRIAGFVSLWSFRFHYSTWLKKVGMAVSIIFFTVSCIGFCSDVFSVGHSCGTFSFRTLGMMFLLGAIGTVYSIYKDLKSVFCAFSSDKTLQRYKDRTDETKDKIDGFISKIKGNSFETNAVRVDLPEIKDFLYYYPNITNVLLRGDSISVSKVKEQKTVRWHKIHENLAYALELINLRKAATEYKNFYNEDKIALVEDPVLPKEGGIKLTISKSCYYATYITVESYRDAIYENGKQVELGNWIPFILVNGEHILPSFRCGSSLHLGVNTLAITQDGFVLVWMQAKGNRSKSLAAPSGSGSMDWDDVGAVMERNMGDHSGNFEAVVRHAAEREFVEETFSKSSTDHVQDILMETRTIGFFRWGSLGGLPGFVCVTKVNATQEQVFYKNKLSEGERRNYLLDLNLKYRYDHEKMLKKINKYIERRKHQMSLPLRASLEILRYVVEKGVKEGKKSESGRFCDWLNS